MDREIKASTLEHFKEERNGFVEEFRALANGHTGGKAAHEIMSDLLRIGNKLFLWSLLTADSNESEHRCFKQKCLSLGAALERFGDRDIFAQGDLDMSSRKIFDMMAMQMGRLTLQGYIPEDNEAQRASQVVELEQLEWDIKPEEDDDIESAIHRTTWTFMHIAVKDCTCSQCWELDSTPCPSPTAGMS